MTRPLISLMLTLCAAPLLAQAKPAATVSAPSAAKVDEQATGPIGPGQGRIALLFNLKDLMTPLSPFSDGFQSGAGGKFWIVDGLAARALVSFAVTPSQQEETSATSLGVSLAGEWHPRPGLVSPYAGGLAGLAILFTGAGPQLDFAFGAIGGVEFAVYKNLSLYAEYQALFTRTIEGLGFALGGTAVLGLAVYF